MWCDVNTHHAASFLLLRGSAMEQQSNEISTCLANVHLNFSFRNPDLVFRFQNFLCADRSRTKTLLLTDELWERHKEAAASGVSDAYIEFYALIGVTSRTLLRHGKCLFHGVAFLWHGLAWIITAPSGTGKTTQLRHWQKLFGDEIELINGDKPVMECREDETVWLYPSPWNGKENLSGTASGRLGGVIYLEQADQNEISRMDLRACMIPLYRQFLYYADYEDEIRAVGRMQDVLLRNVPVWKLRNRGDEASAGLTRDTLLRYLEEMR